MSFPVKIAFDGDIRRVQFANLCYDDLVATARKMFPRLSGVEFSLKYEDEDNELITVASDAELGDLSKERKTFKLLVVLREDKQSSTARVAEETSPAAPAPAPAPPAPPAPKPEIQREPNDAELIATLTTFVMDERVQKGLPKLAEAMLSDSTLDALGSSLPTVDLLHNILSSTPEIASHPLLGQVLTTLAHGKVAPCLSKLRERLIEMLPFIRAFRPSLMYTLPSLLQQLPNLIAEKIAACEDDLLSSHMPCMAQLLRADSEEENVKVKHRGAVCDGCGVSPIVGTRFQCTICANFDLCAACEAKGEHNPLHPLLQLRDPVEVNPVHLGSICNACGATPIKGCRFKCTVCPVFDLCEVCEPKGEHPHPFLKIRKPEVKPGRAGRNQATKPQRQRSSENPAPHTPVFGRQRSFEVAHGISMNQPPHSPAFGRQRSLEGHHGIFPVFRVARGMRARSGSSSVFVSDVTLPDGSDIPINTNVVKTWKLRNDGLQAWPPGTALVLKRCKGEFETTPHPLSRLPAPGEEVEVSATLKTCRVGRGTVCFRLVDQSGVPFGAKVWADVIGVEAKKEAPPQSPLEDPKVEASVAENAKEVSLRALANMGFADVDLNTSLLTEENGNLQRVVNRLLGMAS